MGYYGYKLRDIWNYRKVRDGKDFFLKGFEGSEVCLSFGKVICCFFQVCDLNYWQVKFIEFRRLSCVCWGKVFFNFYWEFMFSILEGKMGFFMEDVCKE